MDLFSVKDKKTIIVGGSGGLGQTIAKGFSENFAKVVVIDLNENEVLSKFSNVSFVKADISKREEIHFSFSKALELLNGLDVLVNCAGIQRRNQPELFTLEDWDDILNINLSSVFLFCQLAGKEMLKNGSGRIINISSIMSVVGGTTIPAYSSSKGGLSQLTKSLSNDWAAKGINVNAIAPGYFDTPLNKNLTSNPDRMSRILSHIPIGRWGNPDEIKGIAIFLASDASSYLTGAVIPLDGGYLAW